MNLVLSDGKWMLATRYAFDYGWYPDDESFFAAEREHDFTSFWYPRSAAASAAATTARSGPPTARRPRRWSRASR